MWNAQPDNSPFKKTVNKITNPTFSVFANILNKKQEIFSQTQPELSNLGPHSEIIEDYYKQLNEAINNLDEKLQGVIDKREATYISAFRTLMRKIEKDFLSIKRALELRETQHKQELEMLGEDAIRKQLTYFREECLELNNLWQKSKNDVIVLERKVADQENEIARLNALVTKQVKSKIHGPKFEIKSATSRTNTRSVSPYHSRLPTADTSPPKSRRTPTRSQKYSKKNIDSTFLKEIFMLTMQDNLNMPKENFEACAERLVELVSASVESRVKEVEIAEKKLEKLKAYYHARMKSVLGVPFSKPLDDILFHFWESFNAYKEKFESASPYSPTGTNANFHSQGFPTKRTLPGTPDTDRSSKSGKPLTNADKVKIMDDMFTNTDVLNILARYSEYAKVLSTNKYRFYGMTAKEALAKKQTKEEELNDVDVNSLNEPTFGMANRQLEIRERMKAINPNRRTNSQPRIDSVSPKENLLSELFEITKSARPYTVRPPTSNRKTRDKKYAIEVEENIGKESFEDANLEFQEEFLNQPPKEYIKGDFQRGGRKYVPLANQSSEDRE